MNTRMQRKNLSTEDLGDIHRKIRHLRVRLVDLTERVIIDDVDRSQIFSIRAIILQYQVIIKLGQENYNPLVRAHIDILWDRARRNETSLIYSIARGTFAEVEQGGIVDLPVEEDIIYEYHSDGSDEDEASV